MIGENGALRRGSGPILIVGAAQGMGRTYAELCAARGDRHLILADIQLELIEELAGQLRGGGATVECHRLDLGDEASVENLLATVRGIDRIALIAAIMNMTPTLELDRVTLERLLRVNLLGNYRLAQGFCQDMIDRGAKGAIVVVTSASARRARPKIAAYAASKAGLTMALKVLALEVAAKGIRINFVLPGATRTAMMVSGVDKMAAEVPLGRVNETDDIARAIDFLLADDSAMMTMREIVSDGGSLLGL